MIQEGKASLPATGGNSLCPNTTTHPCIIFTCFSRIKSFKSELHEVTQQIQEPALLKECAIKLHQKFVLKKVETDSHEAGKNWWLNIETNLPEFRDRLVYEL